MNSYHKSKTLAEQTAWNFMKQEIPKFTLTVINPAIVLGPVPSPQSNEHNSAVVLPRILQAKDPGSRHVFFPMVDVRHVVQAHLQAAEIPEAAGKRFIDVGLAAVDGVDPESLLVEDAAGLYYLVDAFFHFDNSRSKEILKLKYIPVEQTLIDGAYSIIEHGIDPKTPGYSGN